LIFIKKRMLEINYLETSFNKYDHEAVENDCIPSNENIFKFNTV